MRQKLNITDHPEDLNNLIKSVTEEDVIYEIQSQNDSAILISQKSYENL